MYVLYLSTIFFSLYTIYKCLFRLNYDKNLKFENSTEYFFNLDKIDFYKNTECIYSKYYDNKYTVKKNLDININVVFDYMNVEYTYDNKNFKYLTTDSFITFPMYDETDIKKYVYINRITKAEIIYFYNNKECIIDVLKEILPYVGPNYNFYKDTFNKIYLKDIIKFLVNKEINNIIHDKKVILKLKDTFENEYVFNNKNDIITWNPELKL